MKKFNKFYFEKISFDKNTLTASFLFSFDKKVYFEEKIIFPYETKKLDKEILDNILSHLHLAL